ncbi:MAG: GNAT family N-acetyltransferase [Coriobacteriaceae bacterium]|nr:GNAT family N-acetyltransferase [Coriobacteriaceae bacterium]
MTQGIKVRAATPGDAPALAAIYAPYVVGTAITFETVPPSAQEFRLRIEKTIERYPYLVAEGADGIVGYAYAGPFKDRAAYDWSVETSIYVARDHAREGIGGALHKALAGELTARGFMNMYACISSTRTPDEYLDRNSIEFHEHLGYHLVGTFENCASKFGRWYDMVWMEHIIGDHGPAPVRPR